MHLSSRLPPFTASFRQTMAKLLIFRPACSTKPFAVQRFLPARFPSSVNMYPPTQPRGQVNARSLTAKAKLKGSA
jgi:hypothetical protein